MLGVRGTLLALNTLKGQRGVVKLQDGIRKSDKHFSYSLESTSNQPTSWLVHYLEHLWCQDKPQATLDSQDSPQPGFGGSHHLPPIYYSLRLFMAPTSKWLFVLELPRRNFETAKVWTPTTLRDYNSLLRPPIVMRSEAMLQLSSKDFQQCFALYLHPRDLGQFPTFCGRKLNCYFDSQPFFLP